MYQAYWGLKRQPFAPEAGQHELAKSPVHAEALDQEFRIAKVGEHDPVGSLGAVTANFIRAPWLGKLSDPWAWSLAAASACSTP